MGKAGGAAENIRVYARLRPSLEGDDGGAVCWQVEGNSLVQLGGPPAGREVQLDAVFDAAAPTAAVYEAAARPLLPHLLAGFNVTVLAYGQTGSGKTHTMRGGDGDEAGLIPLAVGEVFQLVAACPGRDFQLRLSYLEIYNEQLSDLLAPHNRPKVAWDQGLAQFGVEGLRQEAVKSGEQVLALLAEGERRRRRGATAMNAASSRSHTLLRLEVASAPRGGVGGPAGAPEEAAARRRALLTLVDLAGSERAAKTGAEGGRLREGAAINASLLALGTVVCELGRGGEHVPYRNSQITKVLQPCLGGNAKAALICTLNPAAPHCQETASTLRFAERAMRVVNVVSANTVPPEGRSAGQQALRIQEQASVIDSQARRLAEQEEQVAEQARRLAEQQQSIAALQEQVGAAAAQAQELAALLYVRLAAAQEQAGAASEEAAALRQELAQQAAHAASLEVRLAAADAAAAAEVAALRGQLAEQSAALRAASATSEQEERQAWEAGGPDVEGDEVQAEMEGLRAQLEDAQDEVTRLRAAEQRREASGQRQPRLPAAAPRKRGRGESRELWEELGRTLQASKLQRREAQRLAAATAALLPVSSWVAKRAGRAAGAAPAGEDQLEVGLAVLRNIQV